MARSVVSEMHSTTLQLVVLGGYAALDLRYNPIATWCTEHQSGKQRVPVCVFGVCVCACRSEEAECGACRLRNAGMHACTA
jgi:hypothetical protein